MSEHFKVMCKKCKIIIMQCRCPSKDKRIVKALCEKCKEKCKNNHSPSSKPRQLRKDEAVGCNNFHDDDKTYHQLKNEGDIPLNKFEIEEKALMEFCKHNKEAKDRLNKLIKLRKKAVENLKKNIPEDYTVKEFKERIDKIFGDFNAKAKEDEDGI